MSQPTPQQQQAIAEQAAIYATDDAPGAAGLLYHSIPADDRTYAELEDGQVEAHFHYKHDDWRAEHPFERVGLEVTVFATDGTAVASQDFG